MSEERGFGGGTLLLALIGGAAAGAAVVLLTTSRSGREFRERVRSIGRAGLDEARRYTGAPAEEGAEVIAEPPPG